MGPASSASPRRPDRVDFHQEDEKLSPLVPHELPQEDYATRCRNFLEVLSEGSVSGLRILDVGCGRGDLVWRLRAAGAKAFGVEVESRYIESGRILHEFYPDELPILSLVDSDGRFPFPEDYFDLVVSFQVIEHVADLESLASEIARVLRPGGRTANVFPSKFRFFEPHYHLPLVHWLPKGNLRRRAVSALLRLGFGSGVLRDHDLGSKVATICDYAERETFYRSAACAMKPFASAGLRPDSAEATRSLIISRLGDCRALAAVLGPIMTLVRTTVISAYKPSV